MPRPQRSSVSGQQVTSASSPDIERALVQLHFNQFFDGITAPDHVEAVPVAPHLKTSYDINSSLAVREDDGITQVLRTVGRIGNHGFGLIDLYSEKLPVEGFKFLARLCDTPHSDRPEYIAHVMPDRPILIGAEGTKTSDVGDEGRSTLMMLSGSNGMFSMHPMPTRRMNRSVFQIIRATRRAEEQSDLGKLQQEDRIWAPVPRAIESIAVKVLDQKGALTPQVDESALKPVYVPKPRFKPTKEDKISSHVRRQRRRDARLDLKRDKAEEIRGDALDGLIPQIV